jgi:hypothetical protein
MQQSDRSCRVVALALSILLSAGDDPIKAQPLTGEIVTQLGHSSGVSAVASAAAAKSIGAHTTCISYRFGQYYVSIPDVVGRIATTPAMALNRTELPG